MLSYLHADACMAICIHLDKGSSCRGEASKSKAYQLRWQDMYSC